MKAFLRIQLILLLVFLQIPFQYSTGADFPGYGKKGSLGINIGSRTADPGSGKAGDIYYNSTTNKFKYYDGTVWQEVGSGAGGGSGINFIGLNSSFALTSSTDRDAEISVGNWALFDDGAVSSPVDMTGGATSTLTLSRTTTGGEILNGSGSFKIVKTAADSQGEGVSVSTYVPLGYRGQNSQLTIPFKIISGSLAGSNLKAFGYDVTNGGLVFSGGAYVTGTSLVIENFPVGSSTAQVRIGFMFTSTDATAATFTFDDVEWGPPKNIGQVSQASMYGSVVFPGATGCDWSATSTSPAWGSFGADADCTLPAGSGIVGYASAPATKIPAILFSSLPAGEYRIVATGGIYATANDQCEFQFYDGTNQTTGNMVYPASTGGIIWPVIEGRIKRNKGGSNVQIEIRGRCNGGSAARVYNDASTDNDGLVISVYRYPLESEVAYRADQLANSWSGYHDSTCRWLRANTAYGDPGVDATCVFTERTNTNFGTVASYKSGADFLPGIVFTPSRVGTYFVCAGFGAGGNVTTDNYGFRLTDGTTVITENRVNGPATASSDAPLKLCGPYRASSTSAVTLRIELKASANTAIINNNSYNNAIEWSIFQMDQRFPAPNLVGSVTSNSSGQERIERARVSIAGVVSNESGDWISGDCALATNVFTCTLNANIFSATPICVPAVSGANLGTAFVTSSSSTSVGVSTFDQTSGAASARQFDLICMGPK